MNNRVVYIDALRGLAMLMVVMVHVEGFSVFVEEFHISLFRRICEALMLPMFFFISGYCSKMTSFKDLTLKILRLSLPAILLGVIYTLYINKEIIAFFNNVYKYGYWFTITLCEMYLIFYGLSKIFKTHTHIYMIILSCLLYIIKVPFNNIQNLTELANTFCLHQLFIYFQYFALGYICKNNEKNFDRLLNNELCVVLSIIFFFIAIYVKSVYTDEELSMSLFLKIYRAIQDPILAYTGIFIVFRLFISINGLLPMTLWGNVLCYVGKNTLDIYFLHYFFLPKVSILGVFLVRYPNFILEVMAVFLISAVVIGLSLILGKLIRSNDVLGFLLLGHLKGANNVVSKQ